MTSTTTHELDRDVVIKRIKAALKKRSGKDWSVTGGKGTAWGWIRIDAPPRRRTWQHVEVPGQIDPSSGHPVYEEVDDPSKEFGHMGPADRNDLCRLLNLGNVHHQGVSIPADHDYRREYLDRAEGRTPTVRGQQYWD